MWLCSCRHCVSVSASAFSTKLLNLKPMPNFNNFPPCFFRDKSIPAVESVAGDERSAQELEHLSRLMDQQTHLEEQVVARTQEDSCYHPEVECREPEPCQEFQTARLILSHLGLLSVGALRVRIQLNNYSCSFFDVVEVAHKSLHFFSILFCAGASGLPRSAACGSGERLHRLCFGH